MKGKKLIQEEIERRLAEKKPSLEEIKKVRPKEVTAKALVSQKSKYP